MAAWSTLKTPALCVFLTLSIWQLMHAGFSTLFWTNSTTAPVAYYLLPCQIPKLDPWHKSILKHVKKERVAHCVWAGQLTYPEGAWVWVNQTELARVAAQHAKPVSCHYRAIRRNKNSDNRVTLGNAVPFKLTGGVKVDHEFIQVSCYTTNMKNMMNTMDTANMTNTTNTTNTTKKTNTTNMTNTMNTTKQVLIYRNYHTLVLAPGVPAGSDRRKAEWNVILVGTDSMSRSAGVRYLPDTSAFLLGQLQSVELLGYTKVGLNTFPNIVPLLTGYHVSEFPQDKYNGPYDYLPLIFKNYSAAGYKTFFAEDVPRMSAFNYIAKGFQKPPVDYYYRPLSLLLDRDPNLSFSRCERTLVMTRNIIGYLRQFVTRFQKQRFFALMFLGENSHDSQSTSRRLDQVYLEMLQELQRQGVWEDTLLLVFGDHGARWGGLVNTDVGKLEGNMPMMHIAVPNAFRHKHPLQFENLQDNAQRITTAFDIHKTLLSILGLRMDEAVGGQRGEGAGRWGLSLFFKVPRNRTCDEAGIPLPFCVCYHQEKLSVNSSAVLYSAISVVDTINNLIDASPESKSTCAQLKLHNVSSASAFRVTGGGHMVYEVVLFTSPGHGQFKAFVQHGGNGNIATPPRDLGFVTRGPIGRLNKYGNQSVCAKTPLLRLYCYCK